VEYHPAHRVLHFITQFFNFECLQCRLGDRRPHSIGSTVHGRPKYTPVTHKSINMADYFTTTSADGVRFKLNRDGTWEPDITPISNDGIRFRQSDWGDSFSQVKAAEAAEPAYEDSDALIYKSQVGGFPTCSHFYFVKEMLYLGIYNFTQEHADNNRFVSDFETLESLLTTKYGKPMKVNDIWLNDLYKDDYAERGLAVAAGHHSIFISWEDEKSTLTLQLTGDNYQIKLTIIYQSKRLQALAAAADEREKLAGL